MPTGAGKVDLHGVEQHEQFADDPRRRRSSVLAVCEHRRSDSGQISRFTKSRFRAEKRSPSVEFRHDSTFDRQRLRRTVWNSNQSTDWENTWPMSCAVHRRALPWFSKFYLFIRFSVEIIILLVNRMNLFIIFISYLIIYCFYKFLIINSISELNHWIYLLLLSYFIFL